MNFLTSFTNGTLGGLKTIESHSRHGYGSLVTKYVSKKVAEMGHDVYVGIYDTNTPSRALFEKLGFKLIDEEFLIGVNVKSS